MRCLRSLSFIVLALQLFTSYSHEYHLEHEAVHVTPLQRTQRKTLQTRRQAKEPEVHVEVEIGVHDQRMRFVNMTTPLKDMTSEYTGLIGVGTSADGGPQFQARVVFDTGSTNLWVASVLCKEPPCDNGKSDRFYDPAKSTTQEPWRGRDGQGGPGVGRDIDIMFGTGELKGPLHVDTYRVGPMAVEKQPFAMIRDMRGQVFSSFPFEGILGLAFPSLSFGGIDPFFERVIRNKHLVNNEFAFYLNKDSSRPSALLWGGVDKDLYEGPIVMFPVVQPHYWALELVDFRIGGTSLFNDKSRSNPRYLVVDSGTTYFTAPGHLHDTILSKIPSAKCDSVESYPKMTYVLRSGNGKIYELDIGQETYMVGEDIGLCRPAFMKLDVRREYGPAMILGEVFMRHWFTVFSRGSGDVKEAKVGFAKAKIGAEPKVKELDFDKISRSPSGAMLETELAPPATSIIRRHEKVK
eukprot:TRINITY_DN5008_c0_g2_i3.p1 TRINITY_DN5008_c0_g2~~TRINITY_DN5008_c0_g2_i3.p1  ORF type:complete len:465 (-),score=71.18 TRINITY_DN5008_c0_g2_i3:172-1566(-)